jgi:phenylalanyl-tRNA synthetase beta chain
LQFGFIKKEICDKFDINQEVVYAELDFTKITDLARNNNIRYQVKPKFPQVRRDFALLLDNEITFDALKHIALKTEKNILNSIQLFDVYEGDKLPKGKKSYGVSFYFQDSKKTLTDKHVDKIMGKLQIKFETQLGAQLR